MKKLLLTFVLFSTAAFGQMWPNPGPGSAAVGGGGGSPLIASTKQNAGDHGSPTISTVGATMIAISQECSSASSCGAPTVSGMTATFAACSALQGDGSSVENIQIWYASSVTGTFTPGASVSFTGSGAFASFTVLVFNAKTTCDATFAALAGSHARATVGGPPHLLALGAATPTNDNELVVTAMTDDAGASGWSSVSISSSPNAVTNNYTAGSYSPIADAYVLQTTKTSLTPTWSNNINGSSHIFAVMAAFQ